MRKQVFFIVACLIIGQRFAAAIPAQITYQGTLKQNGTPASGNKHIHFAITDATGIQQYGNAIDTVTLVTQGLFSVPLTFTGIDWENITPYIQVTVENTVMGPPEAVTATVYATIANSVVDGAITTPKLSDASVTRQKIEPTSFQAAGDGFVPEGAIIMFDTGCPTGWIRYAVLDNKFPMGSSTPMNVGGSATHTHSISVDGAHTHNVAGIQDIAVSDPRASWQLNSSQTGWSPAFPGERTDSQGAHNHGGATGSASSLPPYYTLVFCQKQ